MGIDYLIQEDGLEIVTEQSPFHHGPLAEFIVLESTSEGDPSSRFDNNRPITRKPTSPKDRF